MSNQKEQLGRIEIALMAIERAHTATPYLSMVCGAFVLLIAAQHSGVTDLKELLEVGDVSQRLSSFIISRLGDHWNEYLPILTSFPADAICDFLATQTSEERFEFSKFTGSSLPIVDLVYQILDINDNESVADIGCAAGDFMRSVSSKGNGLDMGNLVGYEINPELAAFAEINLLGNGVKSEIVWDDFFNPCYAKEMYDKVFCHPPFGVRGIPERTGVCECIRKAFPDFPEIPASASSDWLFATRVVSATKEGGKAVVIMPPSAMHSQQAESFRRYFIQHGLIEAVVELPVRLFTNTAIPTSLVVFSQGNKSIKMIRAGNLCIKKRNVNVMTDAGIKRIMEALHAKRHEVMSESNPDDICVDVPKSELLAHSCNLTVLRYFADPMTLKQSVKLGYFLKTAKRGAAFTSKDLDELVCDNDTGIQYISSGNINDGVVDAMLPNLKSIPERYDSYCTHNGDVIITRVMANNSAFKVAVVELPEGRMLLPNGNILVVTVDLEKADPYFIKSCLENEYAQRYLRNSAVGNMVKTLHFKSLEMLPIPVMPLERQKEIGEKCREAVRQVVEFRTKLMKAKENLASIFQANAADSFADTKGGL